MLAGPEELNRVIEEKFDRKQAPGLTNFRKSLENVHTQVKLFRRRSARKSRTRKLAMLEKPEEKVRRRNIGREGNRRRSHPKPRANALKRLNEIADFFKKSEPHSPVSYLVQRAVNGAKCRSKHGCRK